MASNLTASSAPEVVRRRLRAAVQTVLIGSEGPPRTLSANRSDDGLFGPGSASWKVHADASMLIGGLRALLLQTMHPLAMAGVAQHSAYREDPFGRLQRTGRYVGTVTFGTRAEAEAAVAGVRRVHATVRGTANGGAKYSANDPHLLAWVHHALVDSFLRSYQRYGERQLSDADADRYVAEQSVLAEMIGATDPGPARSVAELKAWMAAIRPELTATSEARAAARYLVLFRSPVLMAGPYAVISAASVGLLPSFVRRALWLPSAPLADGIVVRPVATALTRGLGWVLRPDDQSVGPVGS